MSLFSKNQWQPWARSWGVSHYPQRGAFGRNEQIAGLRNGYLLQVSWGGDKNATLIVRLRFPMGASLEGIRAALAADPSLDALPGKGKARAKTVIEIGPEKMVRLGFMPEFILRDGSLLWSRRFAWSTPKPEQLKGWVDTLMMALARAAPAFDGKCEQCHTTAVRQFVFVDGVPKLLCGTCQERLRVEGQMAERNYDMLEARYLNGALLGLGMALLGAAGWAALAAGTGRILVAAGLGIGWLVAVAYRRGAGRVDRTGQLIGAVLTLGSVVFGQVLFYAWSVMRVRPDVGFRIGAGWLVYMRLWATSPGTDIIAVVFGLVGALAAFGMLRRKAQGAVIRTADEDPRVTARRAA